MFRTAWTWIVVVSLAAVVVATSRAADDESFPWVAYVIAGDTEVLSGPGESHYVTDRLRLGTEVEVHRRDPGGWLAIRPPRDSFCWLPADKVEMTGQNDVAEVVVDDAVAWMGSNAENVKRHRWQVRLERGEKVFIVGRADRDDAQSGSTRPWYRIAAPAGEFRWIHQDDVRKVRPNRSTAAARNSNPTPRPARQADEPTDPSPIVPATAVQDNAATQDSNWSTARKRGTLEIQPAAYLADEPRRAGERPSAVNTAAPKRGDERVAWTARSQHRDVQQIDRVTSSPTAPQSPLEATAKPAGNRRSDLELERENIETQLSLMVSREPQLWNLAALRGRAEALIERSPSALERGQTRLLLEQIEDFEDLYERHVQSERGVVVPAGDEGASKAAAARVEPRFDGSGWLMPVHSTKKSAPPYAIQDDSGKVVYYVSPAPGVNLHRYDRKRVGIYGQRNTVPGLSAQVLTAHRVIDLQR